MKNITLSANEEHIELARLLARKRRSSLNRLFREWLSSLVGQEEQAARLQALEARLHYVDAGRAFTREEMNER